MAENRQAILDESGLQALLDALTRRGFRVVGPTLRDQAIVYDDIASIADLPRGWRDAQDSGEYRLERRDDAALFGYAVGPHSWKKYLLPPRQRLWQATRAGDDIQVTPEPPSDERFAFIGVRACELHAIAIQDRVLTGGGLASALVEIAETGGHSIAIDESAVPMRDDVAAACELLGLDPLHVANEGRFIAFVPADDAERTVDLLRNYPVSRDAVVIGEVGDGPPGRVSCRGTLGVDRIVDMLSGEQLPRIC